MSSSRVEKESFGAGSAPRTVVWAITGMIASLNKPGFIARIEGAEEYVIHTVRTAAEKRERIQSFDISARKTLFYTKYRNGEERLYKYKGKNRVTRAVRPILPRKRDFTVKREGDRGRDELFPLIENFTATHEKEDDAGEKGADKTDQEAETGFGWAFSLKGCVGGKGKNGRRFVFGLDGVSRCLSIGPCPEWYSDGGSCVALLKGNIVEEGFMGLNASVRGWMRELGRRALGCRQKEIKFIVGR